MELREIDPADEDLTRRFWEIGKAADEVGRPWTTYWPWESARAAFQLTDDARRRVLLAALDGADTVGACEIVLPLLDNRANGYFELFVRPDRQRRGIGTALLEATTRLLREDGRRLMVVETPTPVRGPKSAGTWFTEQHGFKPALTEAHRTVDLHATEARWDRLEREAAPHHQGYRLVTWYDRVPDEHLAGYCELQHAFNDEAPAGDLDLEAEHWDEARVRSKEDRFLAARRFETCTAALAPDGTLVGLTEVVVSAYSATRGLQGGTLVRRGHRGHRLGIALKIANQRAVRARFPDVRLLHTQNADVNREMNAINDRLGFETVELVAEMQREV